MISLDIAQQRLINQSLTASPFEQPAEVVDWLVAVQAQDYAGAKWALGLRLRDAHDVDLDHAFNEGAILRTHVMRPTWHFVTPRDIRWLLTLTAPRVHAVSAGRYRELELDDATLKRSRKALIKALRDGQHLTRDELGMALEKAGVTEARGQRLAYLVMHAELEGVICSGPRRGKQFTYALLEERVPDTPTLKRDEALTTLAQRFFTSHGPATVRDCAKWSGLSSVDVKRGLESVRGRLLSETLNGEEHWFASSSTPIKMAPPSAYLLSVYDEYLIGYHDRSMIAVPEVVAKLFTMGAALTYVIVIDGQIVGSWRRTLNKEAVIIEINPFRPLTKVEQRAVAKAAQRYGEFLQRTVKMAYSISLAI
ncbi:MAG TPA: winged helix DNA-binding domain-containing protein [Anaerolineae bacterium]|nr:winged helix DNA-binding domain-containing protein [Anaerolineae bacterium]